MTPDFYTSSVQEEVPAESTWDHLPRRVQVAGVLMVLLGVVTTILLIRGVSTASYIYLAFYSIPANTAISLFPHEPVLLYFGKAGSILPASLVATAGTVVAGYLDHTVFVPLLNHERVVAYKEKALYRWAIRHFRRWPFATLVITAFSPIPFWPFKVLSFSIQYPLKRYLLAVTLARFPRYLVLTWVGAVLEIPNWLLIGAFLVMICLYFIPTDTRSPPQPAEHPSSQKDAVNPKAEV